MPMTGVRMPGGQSEGFAYDFDGNITNQINFNGAIITNQYDALSRLSSSASFISQRKSFDWKKQSDMNPSPQSGRF
jgi:YD repeat-containing protein